MEKSFFTGTTVPLVISGNQDKSLDGLVRYLNENISSIKEDLKNSGAILLRGFDISKPADFEQIAKIIDPNLKNDYLGTSPRDKVAGTEFVFSASELPNFYPIMQHCEMSYMEQPPIKLFFYCYTEPVYGGETPVCDFRTVYEQLRPEVREAFDKKGVITVRNYSAPDSKSRFNLFELKSWEQIFLTRDKEKVAEQCRKYGIEFEWYDNDKLRLIHRTPAAIPHPETGRKVWFNHTQVFHVAASAIEYKYIHKRQKRLKTFGYWLFISLMVFIKKHTAKPMYQSMHTLFGDGSEIPDSYVENIEEVIWKNLVPFKWQKGDVLIIDNFSVAHGRLPYEGPREIQVCWSA